MKVPPPRFTSAAILALLLLGHAGCRSITYTTVDSWQPPELNARQVLSIAVPQPTGDPHVAGVAHRVMLDSIEESRFYQVVDGQATRTPSQSGADAELIAEVSSRIDMGTQLGGISVRVGDPVVSVEISYKVVEPKTGGVLIQGVVDRIYEGEIRRTDRAAPSAEKVIEDLARECAIQVVTKICPYNAPVTAPLRGLAFGEGAAEVNEGIELAALDRWDEAIAKWKAAYERNEGCHQALYNLGIAHEKRHEFDSARHCYEAARRVSDEDLYQAAIARVDQGQRDFAVVSDQRLARNALDRRPLASNSFRWR